MEKFREAIIALMIIALITGSLYILYSLLIWQILPKAPAVSLLFLLALLKGSIANVQSQKPACELTIDDKRLIKFLLFSVCSVFLVVVYISYLLKSQQWAAWTAFGLCLFTLKRAFKFLPAY